MPRPNANNLYITSALQTWSTPHYTFVLIENTGSRGGFIVRVFPHDDRESFWLENGPWESESGARGAILNYIDDKSKE